MAVINAIREAVRAFLPRERRVHRIRSGPLVGRLIYTSWHDYPGAIRGDTESALLGWFGRTVLPGQTWLDVGAHYGYTALSLAGLVGPGGRVFAFEPVPETAACIAQTRDLNQLPQLQIITAGLSAGPGQTVRTVPIVRGMADLTTHFSDMTRSVTLVPFDALWSRICEGDSHVDGVKIDVQGMEQQVLEGMSVMLLASRPLVVVEFHRGADRAAILELLRCAGYSDQTDPIEPGRKDIQDDQSYIFVPRHA